MRMGTIPEKSSDAFLPLLEGDWRNLVTSVAENRGLGRSGALDTLCSMVLFLKLLLAVATGFAMWALL